MHTRYSPELFLANQASVNGTERKRRSRRPSGTKDRLAVQPQYTPVCSRLLSPKDVSLTSSHRRPARVLCLQETREHLTSGETTSSSVKENTKERTQVTHRQEIDNSNLVFSSGRFQKKGERSRR